MSAVYVKIATNPLLRTLRRQARLGAAMLGVCGVAAHGAAFAQDGSPAAGHGAARLAANQLQEVIVTAERRATTVQRTPMSITAVTGRSLQQQGLSSMLSLAQRVPGISFKTAGPGQTEYEMRGLTSSGGESPTVGVYLDGVILTPAAFALNGKTVVDPNMYDLNRVEVLRGPQGTLYGAGSMGGTIRFETNPPDPKKLEGSAEAVLSDTAGGGGFNHTENAMLNLPLGNDRAALRLVGTEKTVDGWIDRIVLDPFPPEVANSTARGDVAHTRASSGRAHWSKWNSNHGPRERATPWATSTSNHPTSPSGARETSPPKSRHSAWAPKQIPKIATPARSAAARRSSSRPNQAASTSWS